MIQETNVAQLNEWEETGETAVCLKCKNEEEMDELDTSAQSHGIVSYIVHDAGRTQIACGSKTVLAIGPARISLIDKVTGHLKLY